MCAISSLTSTFAISSPDEFLFVYTVVPRLSTAANARSTLRAIVFCSFANKDWYITTLFPFSPCQRHNPIEILVPTSSTNGQADNSRGCECSGTSGDARNGLKRRRSRRSETTLK